MILKFPSTPTHSVIPGCSPPFRGSAFPNPRHSAKGCSNPSLAPPNRNPCGVRSQPKRELPTVGCSFLFFSSSCCCCCRPCAPPAPPGAEPPGPAPAPLPSRAEPGWAAGPGPRPCQRRPCALRCRPWHCPAAGAGLPFRGARQPGAFPGGCRALPGADGLVAAGSGGAGRSMVKHQPLQYYEPQLCLSCLTGIYGCRWKRYQRSHDDTTKWERLWFLILTSSFFLTLVWFYFWWEVHNDYNEINW
ncbi:glycerophosphodiester phosphodiesterase domain-containing protein 5 [Agelaius tricolor]|uniref:glycerophosphodiester phosphodiesterase domain-containing protein 5 n=1 Tax=Agelaius tricolor TaxID=9191 RepID=UPI0039F23336